LAGVLQREEVRALKAESLRQAVADTELQATISNISTSERAYMLADAYYRNTVIVYEELKSMNDNLIQQFLTIRAMMNIDPNLRDMVMNPQIIVPKSKQP
jgi:hypothetical protein